MDLEELDRFLEAQSLAPQRWSLVAQLALGLATKLQSQPALALAGALALATGT